MSLFNHHKYKRKFGRGLRQASDLLFVKNNNKCLKDFAWHKSKPNPFGRDQDRNWPFIFRVSLLSIFLLGMLLIGLCHPFFSIKQVRVEGLQRIKEKELVETVLGALNYHKFFILPASNYFLANLNEVRDVVKEKFPIQSIVITKTFPNILNILLEEKISTVIYDNGINYSYIGVDGKVVEILRQVGADEWRGTAKITTSTNEKGEVVSKTEIIDQIHTPPAKSLIVEVGDYPIVYVKQGKNAELNNYVLESEIVAGIIQWFNLINKRTDVPFGYVAIDNDLGEGVIKTSEGWELKVKLNEKIEEQFKELDYLLKNKIKRPNLQYIDLRYLGRVFWQ